MEDGEEWFSDGGDIERWNWDYGDNMRGKGV